MGASPLAGAHPSTNQASQRKYHFRFFGGSDFSGGFLFSFLATEAGAISRDAGCGHGMLLALGVFEIVDALLEVRFGGSGDLRAIVEPHDILMRAPRQRDQADEERDCPFDGSVLLGCPSAPCRPGSASGFLRPGEEFHVAFPGHSLQEGLNRAGGAEIKRIKQRQ